MKTKDGKLIISCVMSNDTRKNGPCATCRHRRTWLNSSDIREGEPDYCDAWDKVKEDTK